MTPYYSTHQILVIIIMTDLEWTTRLPKLKREIGGNIMKAVVGNPRSWALNGRATPLLNDNSPPRVFLHPAGAFCVLRIFRRRVPPSRACCSFRSRVYGSDDPAEQMKVKSPLVCGVDFDRRCYAQSQSSYPCYAFR